MNITIMEVALKPDDEDQLYVAMVGDTYDRETTVKGVKVIVECEIVLILVGCKSEGGRDLGELRVRVKIHGPGEGFPQYAMLSAPELIEQLRAAEFIQYE